MSSTRTRVSVRDRAVAEQRKHTPPGPPDRIWWSVGALVICLALLFMMVWGMFRVRQVDVVGNKLPVSTIVDASAVTGENIFTVRSDDIVSRLSGLHEIVVQRVETSFPDRVTIYASMRQPMVVWQTQTGRFELDSSGNIIRRAAATTLPIVTGTGARSGRLDPGIVVAVRYAVSALPAVPNGAVNMFRVESGTGLTIVGRGGWSAIVGTGSAQTLVDRIASLTAILNRVKNQPRHLQLADLRFHPITLHFASR